MGRPAGMADRTLLAVDRVDGKVNLPHPCLRELLLASDAGCSGCSRRRYGDCNRRKAYECPCCCSIVIDAGLGSVGVGVIIVAMNPVVFVVLKMTVVGELPTATPRHRRNSESDAIISCVGFLAVLWLRGVSGRLRGQRDWLPTPTIVSGP